MILSDQDIKTYLAGGALGISPIDDPDLQIQPASVDLRLGDHFICDDGVAHGEFSLLPGEFLLGHTIESIRLPNDLVGRVEGRSSWGRMGLMVHLTAGFVDPGFEGQITLEFLNASAQTILLTPGERICQLSLYRMTSPSARPYGAARGSKYHGQMGATPARGDR